MTKGLDAIILAGGQGTRLRSVVSDRPKPMASMDGVPFLDLLLYQLAQSGLVRSVVLAIGYKSDFVRDFFAEGTRFGLPLRLSVEHEPLGTGGALLQAVPLTGGSDILVLNGDSYVEADLATLAEAHRSQQADVTLTLVRTDMPERYGTVECDPQGRVLRFREKAADVPAPALINAGLYLFRRGLLENVPPRRPLSLETDVFPAIPPGGIRSVVAQGRFIDIGLPETYSAAHNLLADLITAASRDIRKISAS